MTMPTQDPNSLPEEFRRPPVSFSLKRVLIAALLMGTAAIVVWRVFPDRRNQENSAIGDSSQNGSVQNLMDGSSPGSKGPEEYLAHNDTQVSREKYQLPTEQTASNGRFHGLEVFAVSTLPKLVWNPARKRAFVGGSVVNMRDRPGGKLVGQLLNGEEVSILEWSKDAPFVKIATQFGLVAYVSADLLTYEQFRGVFSQSVLPTPFDSFALDSIGESPSPEFSREYESFQNLLRGLPTKPSFDHSKSNLKYMVVSSSSVIFPAEPAAVLGLVRSVTAKAPIFFERSKNISPGPLDPELEIKVNAPVRRVFENGSAKSTKFEKILVARGCPRKRLSAVTEDGTGSSVELLIFDINKKIEAKLSSKPHRGNPAFTWAYADLNGDSWQDVAIYFGGESSMAPYRYLFVAHNVAGVWQLHRIEDYSYAAEFCASHA